MTGLDLTGDLHRRRGRGRVVVLAVVVLVVLAGAGWWYANRPPPPDEAAAAFAAAWDAGDPGDGPASGGAGAAWETIRGGMGDAPVEVELTGVTTDPEEDATAEATLSLTWTLPGGRTWTYPTTAPMARTEDGWQIRWTSAVAHPELGEGASLAVIRTTAERADVLAADGTPLVTARPVVAVGIQPSRVEDLDATVTAVREVLELELEELPGRIEAAGPEQFVSVVTLREPDYEQIRDDLRPIPGTVFQRQEQALAPTRDFARATLGQAGPVTAELVEAEPERYQAGDVAGLSGLQRLYDEQLGGRPGLEVRAVPAEGTDVEPTTLFTAEPEAGTPVTVTLEQRVQEAADAALADIEEFPTALVAIRVSDGHVLAIANGPGSGGLDLALTGRYPPGSTFKVVTTAALLVAGLAVDDEVSCPPSTTIDGRSFTNAEDQALGAVPFRTAFARSCNTAFIEAASDLASTALRDATATFGTGAETALGVPAFTGEVPETEGGTDLAASSIGQGRVLYSPFAAADLAATVARGAALPPTLVLDDGLEVADRAPLPARVAEALPVLMRAVVTDGSGGALADVPGGPVHAKTGTAEYGNEAPPRTHAWVIGWQGDLAFAVLVAETPDAFGGQVAAPVAAEFLTALASG